jgi:hypothetical protein
LKYIIHLLFPAAVVVCLFTAGAAFVFTCFFFPSALCTALAFSTGADTCCCFVVVLVALVDLLVSSLVTTFLPVDG